MKTYKMLGGGSVTGKDAQEIIETIRSFSFNPGDSLDAFMEQTAEACKLYNGSIIRTMNYEILVKDLIVNNFLRGE